MAEDTEYSDLIDVSDVAPILDDEAIDLPDYTEPPSSNKGDFFIGSFGERISAALIDLFIAYSIYWTGILIYIYIFVENTPFDIPFLSTQGLILHGIILASIFLYFFVSEYFFKCTIGKSLCGLTVKRSDGRTAGIFGIALRNILRPIDIVLFPINLIIMEKSAWHQRLGDFLARTVIIKWAPGNKRSYAPSTEVLASATGRTVAFIVDASLLITFIGGIAFLLNNYQSLLSLGLLVTTPLLLFFGIIFFEILFHTSPGKWIFGYVVCREDGSNVGWSGAVIRTFYILFDCTPWGFISMLTSPRHQRPGDCAAGTLVIKQRREIKGLLSLLLGGAICCVIGYAGWQSHDSLIKEEEAPRFLIHYSSTKKYPTKIQARLSISDLKYALGNANAIMDKPYFTPLSKVFITFSVNGFREKGNQPWLSEDLTIRYPDGTTALHLENLVEFRQPLQRPGAVKIKNNFDLPANAPPGRYTLVITLHDKWAEKTLKRHYFFYVTAEK